MRKKRCTHEEYIKKVKAINPHIEIIGKYTKARENIKWRCMIHDITDESRADTLLNKNRGCIHCYTDRNKDNINIKERGIKSRKSHEQFIREMNVYHPDIKIIGLYEGNNKPIECECLIDGYCWSPIPDNLLSKHSGCPKCNLSKSELAIAKYLDNNNIDFDTQYNYCIEFDGEQHYKAIRYWGGLEGFIDRKIRDTIKNYYCQQNNIKLIRIPYWDFDNIENILKQELSL